VDRATNPEPLTGGADAETWEHAAGRAAETLWAHERVAELAGTAPTLDQSDRAEVLSRRAPERATTVPDTERILLDLPGARIARVRAWTDRDPRYPGTVAPGAMAVVVVPHLPAGAPYPTEGLLTWAQAYLDARRVVCTRPVVTGPTYLPVTVSATVTPLAGSTPDGVRQAVLAALAGFLHPLTGGPSGRGWPFGRDVYRSEVLQVIATTPGVDHVRDLDLVGADGEPTCGNLCVPETWLVRSGEHRIDIDTVGTEVSS
jgi:predicted phage baseplate assembly protein